MPRFGNAKTTWRQSMKSLSSLRLFGMATLLFSLMAIPLGALAQQDAQTQTQPQAQAPAEQTQAPDAQQTQTFTGKLVKSKGSVVLKSDSGNMAYGVDNAAQAKAYVGKNVKITGTLDPATNMIHVSNIEIVPGS
jgi:lipopolysaccharide export system protein LptA